MEYIPNIKPHFCGTYAYKGNKIKEISGFEEKNKIIIDSGLIFDSHGNEIHFFIFQDRTGIYFSPESYDYGEYHVEKTYFEY